MTRAVLRGLFQLIDFYASMLFHQKEAVKREWRYRQRMDVQRALRWVEGMRRYERDRGPSPRRKNRRNGHA